jgi:hypothetical protein
LRIKKRADIHILGGLLFIWDVVSSFQNTVLVAASQKPQFLHPKNRKHTFCGKKQKTASMVFFDAPRATSDMGLLKKLFFF